MLHISDLAALISMYIDKYLLIGSLMWIFLPIVRGMLVGLLNALASAFIMSRHDDKE